VSLADLLPPAGDEVCVYGPERDWTRSELRRRAEEWAASLAIAPRTAVGTPLPNGGELIARVAVEHARTGACPQPRSSGKISVRQCAPFVSRT
jgi:hypothetical protein